eukprot:CAMPEP_0197828138 /NCGR_PEP_ID=MMETSP1437-20131217/4774_1 /TAXON_ID=49252 ORGANISM="Eucampia antarctica, Strain CCMP1452" /NCGR_SAMPLE_ID=MMETSP1437 /ASSEMBLY_ACC=CAM_ASM_001096 /LENGTH=491 /DNA_ID=CAMNT_0043429255 /DNA_START=76 /DNA_END=1551 /DNA_ORIENTATION=+
MTKTDEAIFQNETSQVVGSTEDKDNGAVPLKNKELDENGFASEVRDDDDDDEEAPDNSKVVELEEDSPWSTRMWEVFTTFWMLGFVAFGGPQAHVAILRDHLVVQRNWMGEDEFTELFAIGQGLPGPTSTQLVISTALSRAGPLGGLMAFFLWNLPGLVVLTTCGMLIKNFVDPNDPPFYLIGLPPAAISLVFKAFYGFSLKLDKPVGIILALISSCIAILINGDENISPTSSQYVFPSVLVCGGLVTYLDSKLTKPFGSYNKSPSKGWDATSDRLMKRIGIPLWVGALIFAVWLGVLIMTIVLVDVVKVENEYLEVFEVMYRIGSIIFGGGQVVLPMLQDEVVPKWMSKDNFLQGLGLAQSMPGPLFNFSAYLGAVYQKIPGALIAYIGLFGPGVILIFAIVPFWARLRHFPAFRIVLQGVNATAIGLVGAACVILWEEAITTRADAIIFCVAGTMAVVFNIQAPIVVILGGILGALLFKDAASLGQKPF